MKEEIQKHIDSGDIAMAYVTDDGNSCSISVDAGSHGFGFHVPFGGIDWVVNNLDCMMQRTNSTEDTDDEIEISLTPILQ